MLAILRLALGWHFLYEGVWKIRHPDLFLGETEGFLSGARGPVAGLFYAMLPDIDGRQRLEDNLPRSRARTKKSTSRLPRLARWPSRGTTCGRNL